MLSLTEIPHIMADGYVCDDRRTLAFLSLWGRDTAIQELLARLTLKNEEALTQFTLTSSALHEHLLFPGNADHLDKRTTRHPHTRFGTLVHLWLFDRRCLSPDKSTGQALLLLEQNDPLWQQRLWALFQETVTLPLLDHWQDTVLALLQDTRMLTLLPGHYGALAGWQLALDLPRLTGLISDAILRGELNTSACAAPSSHTRRVA